MKLLSDGAFHSGTDLGKKLGITRAAVCKNIRRLTQSGLDVHRVTGRLGLRPEKLSADDSHAYFEALLPPETYYAAHLNLIRHGREVCHARNPECERCVLQSLCDYYQATRKNTTPKKPDRDREEQLP